MFPFGHVGFPWRPAGRERLILTVENCAQVFELALDVIHYKVNTEKVEDLRS